MGPLLRPQLEKGDPAVQGDLPVQIALGDHSRVGGMPGQGMDAGERSKVFRCTGLHNLERAHNDPSVLFSHYG